MSTFSIDVPMWITVRIKADTAEEAIAQARKLGMQIIDIESQNVDGHDLSEVGTAYFDKIPEDSIADEWEDEAA